MLGKECTIYENKICDECGDCEFCDINPDKICDNCGKCITTGDDYNTIQIDDLLIESEDTGDIRDRGWNLMNLQDEYKSDEWAEEAHHCSDHHCHHHH